MSSVQSAFAQVGPREKYLVQVGTPASGQAVTVNANQTVSSSMTAAEFGPGAGTATTAATLAAGALYRDMGKTINVYNPVTNLAVERYVGTQLVAGAATEGFSSSAVLVYIRVWAADPAKTVGVARTG